jgi:phospholipid/cholesterol/gamma-HCH transport system permease protein
LLPTIAVAIPLTVLIVSTLNTLLAAFGAVDISGAGAVLGAVTQLGPLTTVLVVASAGSTAICADLGARTIREEIDAMEVLGIDPIHRAGGAGTPSVPTARSQSWRSHKKPTYLEVRLLSDTPI